jgi:hypothetical protein
MSSLLFEETTPKENFDINFIQNRQFEKVIDLLNLPNNILILGPIFHPRFGSLPLVFSLAEESSRVACHWPIVYATP